MCRWCAWDLNLGQQDGRCRAMSALHLNCNLTNCYNETDLDLFRFDVQQFYKFLAKNEDYFICASSASAFCNGGFCARYVSCIYFLP